MVLKDCERGTFLPILITSEDNAKEHALRLPSESGRSFANSKMYRLKMSDLTCHAQWLAYFWRIRRVGR
jgi:hypothetical protein